MDIYIVRTVDGNKIEDVFFSAYKDEENAKSKLTANSKIKKFEINADLE